MLLPADPFARLLPAAAGAVEVILERRAVLAKRGSVGAATKDLARACQCLVVCWTASVQRAALLGFYKSGHGRRRMAAVW